MKRCGTCTFWNRDGDPFKPDCDAPLPFWIRRAYRRTWWQRLLRRPIEPVRAEDGQRCAAWRYRPTMSDRVRHLEALLPEADVCRFEENRRLLAGER